MNQSQSQQAAGIHELPSAAAAPRRHADAAVGPVARVEHLRRQFRRTSGETVPAIDDVTFEMAAGQLVVLLGPSGCGKTTLLRCIAGLEQPDAGRIELNGAAVFNSKTRVNVPTERRGLSMVPQSYALWPHMTVFDNIAYPLRSARPRRFSRAETEVRVRDAMRSVGIEALAQQYPNQISGGQQQRVALARALVANASVVLFDEPLSNIDAKVREQLRLELLETQRRFGFAGIFVTHDRQEAMILADSIIVLQHGRIAQAGTPHEVYTAPVSRYVANFIGPANEIPVAQVDQLGDAFTAACSLGKVVGGSKGAGSDGLAAVWRPEASRLTARQHDRANEWDCTVTRVLFYGTHTEYVVRAGDEDLTVTTRPGDDEFAIGVQAWLTVEPSDVRFLPN